MPQPSLDVTTHIRVVGACENNLKNVDIDVVRNKITLFTGVSGSGKSSLAFDTILAESQRRFFYTLSSYSRQFLDLGTRPSVKQISGLSPSISLSQVETHPSPKATVASLTDISELLGVVFSRYGDKYCPDHQLPTSAQSIDSLVERNIKKYSGETVAICVNVVEKKLGQHKKKLEDIVKKGFSKVFVNGDLIELDPIPVLNKQKKHTISLVVDYIKVSDKTSKRVERSLARAFELGEGVAQIGGVDPKSKKIDKLMDLSLAEGCAECGFSWPLLDPRHFNANSLGQCDDCGGYGVLDIEYYDESETEVSDHNSALDEVDGKCSSCRGTGISSKYHAVKLGGLSISDIYLMPLTDLTQKIDKIILENSGSAALVRVLRQIRDQLTQVISIGLSYITLDRRVLTLSRGETQRLRLANILGENLRGVLYVFDEPSQGLHPSEIKNIWSSIEKLKEQGNTILIVDHDETLIKMADTIVDMGPGGGANGGKIVAVFSPKDASKYQAESKTAGSLVEREKSKFLKSKLTSDDFIALEDVSLFNLNIKKVRFNLGAINIVTGVSGAGKTSLVSGVLFGNYVRNSKIKGRSRVFAKKPEFFYASNISGLESLLGCHLINRKPIAKSRVSIPASYLDIFTDIRKLFEKLPESQICGLTARSFSLSVEGGRCAECKGQGEVNLSMRFLSDARVKCGDCEGKRYKPHVLEVKYRGYTLNDILNLTMDEAFEVFKAYPKIAQKIQKARDLGLGYLTLGQPNSTLSGGEAQRLKLVSELSRKSYEGRLYILDEPTTGLHFEDVERLYNNLTKITEQGGTVIMTEHNIDLIRLADWVVDLGPGSASNGGRLVYEGPPAGLVKCKDSKTGTFLG